MAKTTASYCDKNIDGCTCGAIWKCLECMQRGCSHRPPLMGGKVERWHLDVELARLSARVSDALHSVRMLEDLAKCLDMDEVVATAAEIEGLLKEIGDDPNAGRSSWLICEIYQ